VLLLTTGFLLGAEPLTLNRALEIAERQHPALQAGLARMENARAGIQTAKGRLNPEAGFLAGKQTVQGPGSPSNVVPLVTFSQQVEWGALRPSRIAVAEKNLDTTRYLFDETRLSVLSQVRRTFYEVLRRDAEIDLAEGNLRLVEDLRDRIRVRVDVGEVGRLELTRAEAEVASAKMQVSSARLRRVAALARFSAAVGDSLEENVQLQGTLDPAVKLPPLAELRREVLSRHPAVAAAHSEVSRAEARIDYEEALRRPQPSFRVEVDMTGPMYRAGISIPLPTRNHREGPIAEAVANLRATRAESRAEELQITTALESAYGRYEAANQQVELLSAGPMRAAEAALTAAQTAYRLGERGILEVLDAQRLLRSVRQDFVTAEYDREASLIDLDELRVVDLRSRP
jgi:cobalt-zinc-cadmium efflux system outer membrane protein